MKKFIAFCILNILFYVVNSQDVGTLINIKVSVPYFNDALLVENIEQNVSVYLPPSYYLNTEKKYPVVYYLHGFGDAPGGYSSMNMLIAVGKTKEMIIVSPNCTSKLIGPFYVNSPITGNWEDYICYDLVNYIDNNYRTIAKPEARALSGHSMGGYGALNLSMLHPDIFCIGYGMSPGLFEENGLNSSQILTTSAKNSYFTFTESVAGLSKATAHAKYLDFIKTIWGSDNLFALAYGSAFSPNTSLNAPYINYPYAKNGSEIITDSANFKNYENGFGNLKEKTKKYKSNLEKLKGYVIDYGTSDEYNWIVKGCVYFDKVLTEENINHNYAPYSGNHSSGLETRISKFMIPFCDSLLEFDTAHFNTEALITGIKISKQVGDAIIDTVLKSVNVVVQSTSDLTKLKPTIYVSSGTSITPASGIETDFSNGSATYTLVSEDGKKTAVWTVNVALEPTSINSTSSENNFYVYPNPASDKLYLSVMEPNVSIQIFDLGGSVAAKGNYSNNSVINISELKEGIYFIKVKGKHHCYSSKFIVQ